MHSHIINKSLYYYILSIVLLSQQMSLYYHKARILATALDDLYLIIDRLTMNNSILAEPNVKTDKWDRVWYYLNNRMAVSDSL